jgi:hypothetical protein
MSGTDHEAYHTDSENAHPMDQYYLQNDKQQQKDKVAGDEQNGQEATSLSYNPESDAGSQSDKDDADGADGEAAEAKGGVQPTPAPVGVVIVDDAEEMLQSKTMERLLRMPRYFDDNVEAASFAKQVRCYRCGQAGHVARACTSATLKPCSLCAETDHEAATCPNRKHLVYLSSSWLRVVPASWIHPSAAVPSACPAARCSMHHHPFHQLTRLPSLRCQGHQSKAMLPATCCSACVTTTSAHALLPGCIHRSHTHASTNRVAYPHHDADQAAALPAQASATAAAARATCPRTAATWALRPCALDAAGTSASAPAGGTMSGGGSCAGTPVIGMEQSST